MKQVKIKIEFDGEKTLKLRIRGGLFRKVSLDIDNKFQGCYSLTKIINRIRKIMSEYFNN
jgi:hypothetical protein